MKPTIRFIDLKKLGRAATTTDSDDSKTTAPTTARATTVLTTPTAASVLASADPSVVNQFFLTEYGAAKTMLVRLVVPALVTTTPTVYSPQQLVRVLQSSRTSVEHQALGNGSFGIVDRFGLTSSVVQKTLFLWRSVSEFILHRYISDSLKLFVSSAVPESSVSRMPSACILPLLRVGLSAVNADLFAKAYPSQTRTSSSHLTVTAPPAIFPAALYPYAPSSWMKLHAPAFALPLPSSLAADTSAKRISRHCGHHPGLHKHILYQVLKACWFLEQMGVYHMDIKPDNVLAYPDPSNQTMHAWLADFGLVAMSSTLFGAVEYDTHTEVVTETFKAPEQYIFDKTLIVPNRSKSVVFNCAMSYLQMRCPYGLVRQPLAAAFGGESVNPDQVIVADDVHMGETSAIFTRMVHAYFACFTSDATQALFADDYLALEQRVRNLQVSRDAKDAYRKAHLHRILQHFLIQGEKEWFSIRAVELLEQLQSQYKQSFTPEAFWETFSIDPVDDDERHFLQHSLIWTLSRRMDVTTALIHPWFKDLLNQDKPMEVLLRNAHIDAKPESKTAAEPMAVTSSLLPAVSLRPVSFRFRPFSKLSSTDRMHWMAYVVRLFYCIKWTITERLMAIIVMTHLIQTCLPKTHVDRNDMIHAAQCVVRLLVPHSSSVRHVAGKMTPDVWLLAFQHHPEWMNESLLVHHPFFGLESTRWLPELAKRALGLALPSNAKTLRECSLAIPQWIRMALVLVFESVTSSDTEACDTLWTQALATANPSGLSARASMYLERSTKATVKTFLVQAQLKSSRQPAEKSYPPNSRYSLDDVHLMPVSGLTRGVLHLLRQRAPPASSVASSSLSCSFSSSFSPSFSSSLLSLPSPSASSLSSSSLSSLCSASVSSSCGSSESTMSVCSSRPTATSSQSASTFVDSHTPSASSSLSSTSSSSASSSTASDSVAHQDPPLHWDLSAALRCVHYTFHSGQGYVHVTDRQLEDLADLSFLAALTEKQS
jgi:serine/threonine protein kinase